MTLIIQYLQNRISSQPIHDLYHALAILLLFTTTSCQPTDTYEVRYKECFKNVTAVEFEIEGSTKKGVGYSGFDPQCLVGAPLPDFSVADINGKTITTKNLLGKVTVINFWFIKCAPCIAEIPDLNSIVNKFGEQKVNYLAFSKDAEPTIKEFLKTNTFLFQHIPNDKATIEESFRLMWGYPSTMVVDREGRIVEIFRGAKLKSDPSVNVTVAVDSLLMVLLSKE